MDIEIWKASGISNYEISNFGNIRRLLDDNTYKYLQGSITNKGYKYFQIQLTGKRFNYLIHQLVAMLFIGPRPDKLVVDHIDRNKLNNHISNLRYITHKENVRNSTKYYNWLDEDNKIKRRNKLGSIRYYKKNGGPKSRRRGTGQLHQRKDTGSWRCVITTKLTNHKKLDKTFKTKEEAEKWLKQYQI